MENKPQFLAAQLSPSGGDEKTASKLHIVANAGSLMQFDDGDVVLNMERLTLSKHSETPPILHSHDWQRPLGHFLNCAIEDGRIVVDALLSCDNNDVKEVQASLSNGFPWQASLGFSLTSFKTYQTGEKFTVNGQEYTAQNKTYVADGIDVWECSVVLFGADGCTSVVKAKHKNKEADKIMADEIKKENSDNLDVKASAAAETTQPTPSAPDVQAELHAAREEIKAAQMAELARVKALKELADKYEAQTKLADAIAGDVDPVAFELDVLRASYGKAPAVQVEKDSMENSNNNKVFEAAAVMRAGFTPKGYSDKVMEAADKYASYDFRDMFEALTGYKPTYEARRQGDVWAAGASTYSLNSLLADAGTAIMLQAFEADFQQWRQIFKVSTVSDFKAVDRWRVAADVEFKEMANGGEMQHFTADDYKFSIQAGVYGRQGEVTYQDLINGQFLDVFGEIMRRFAQGASEAINKKCWALFLNPPTDGAGNNFFSTAHDNYMTNSALTYATLGQAVAAYQTRKRGYGADADAYLGIKPTKIIIPAELEWDARIITKAGTFGSSSGFQDYNPAASYGLGIVTVPQLSDTTYGGAASSTTWYLSNDANRLAAFEIAFLNGRQAPVLRQQDLTIGRLGIAFDGHIDFGVAAEDWRGMMRCDA